MAYDNTTVTLLAEIKQRGMIPSSQKTYDTEAILRRATTIFKLGIMRDIMSAREEYFIFEETASIPSNGIVNVPTRAAGGVLRDLLYDDGNGNFRSIPLLDPEQRERQNFGTIRDPMFYLRWNKIIVKPVPTGASRLLIPYYIKPGYYVETTAAAQVQSIDKTIPAAPVITLSGTVPSTFVDGTVMDFIKNDGMFNYISINQTATTVLAQDVTMSAAVDDDLAVGDWLTLKGESPVIQAPEEFMPLLAQETAASILESLGDPKHKDAYKTADDLRKALIDIINPRVQGEVPKIVTNMSGRRYYIGA